MIRGHVYNSIAGLNLIMKIEDIFTAPKKHPPYAEFQEANNLCKYQMCIVSIAVHLHASTIDGNMGLIGLAAGTMYNLCSSPSDS